MTYTLYCWKSIANYVERYYYYIVTIYSIRKKQNSTLSNFVQRIGDRDGLDSDVPTRVSTLCHNGPLQCIVQFSFSM